MKPILQRFAAALGALLDNMPTTRRGRVGQRHEPITATAGATNASIMSAIRSAESNGETRLLFALYRDITVAGSHVQAEFGKRKMAVLGQPMAVLPEDKDDDDDVLAADAVRQMIADCENWTPGLTHLMDATLWPVASVEKIYRPVVAGALREGAIPLRFTLRRLEIVNPTLLCFRQDYTDSRANDGRATLPRSRDQIDQGAAGALPYQAEVWEKDLRFYATDADGRVDYSAGTAYAAEPERHIIHRGHLLVGVRDNWGGPMRAIVFWWFLSQLARDWFGRGMERYGAPFVVGRTDVTDNAKLTMLQEAFSLSTKIGGLVVDEDSQIELKEIATSNMADAYEKFINVCNREVSKVIVGQTASAEVQPSGLGSGSSDLAGEVRDDIRTFDKLTLGETLRRQLFEPFLRINGLAGRAPKIVWGGLSAGDSAAIADLLVKLSQASLEPADEALPTISEKVGFQIQRKAAPEPTQGFGPTPFRAQLSTFNSPWPQATHPSDAIAAARAKALGEAYRGALAPVRLIIQHSTSPEDARMKLAAFYADWKPEKVQQLTEEALQIAAAAGAAAAQKVEGRR